jgi:hypothetical protein
MNNLRVFLIVASGGMIGGLVTGSWDFAASWVVAAITYFVITEAAR